jgi:hypothetical protein
VYGGGTSITVRNSKFHDNDDALQLIDAGNTLVYNNLFYNNRSGIGYSDSQIQYYNNTFVNDGLSLTGGSNIVRNNIFFNSPINESSGSHTLSNNLTSDPNFVSSSDFHLTSGSPARDAGTSLPEVPCDFDGNGRPAGSAYDIGAYEYGGTPSSGCSKGGGGTTPTPTPAPNQPPTVSITAIPSTLSVAGQGTTLQWSTTNATSSTASGGWSGSQALGGVARFTPTGTTIYTLTCVGPGGTGQGNATVTVGAASACTLYTSGSTIPQGFGVPWDVQNPSIMLLNAQCTPPTVLFKAGNPNTTSVLYVVTANLFFLREGIEMSVVSSYAGAPLCPL